MHCCTNSCSSNAPSSRPPYRRPCWVIHAVGLLLLLGAVLTGCSSSDEAHTEGELQEAPAPQAIVADPDSTVQTIQLYEGSDERAFPIIRLNSDDQLTLEFDLLTEDGRPLSVYFFHADQQWNRDLTPSQYMQRFDHDSVLNYRRSRNSEVPYVHYEYEFPNNSIDFTISGNYIMRVTEQGRRDDVLFERAFYVTEQQARGTIDVEAANRPGQRWPNQRPSLLFTPPSDLRGNPFNFTVCFARNDFSEAPQCAQRPLLSEQPNLQFELRRPHTFRPTSAPITLDLSRLRTSRNVERTDRSQRPTQVTLREDNARFLGEHSGMMEVLNGQSVIRAAMRHLGDPQRSSPYVDVQFRFVPPDRVPADAPIRLRGSFISRAEGQPMRWNADAERYETIVRMKQGMHEYTYVTSDEAVRSILENRLPRRENRFLALVYYRDVSLSTDRLLQIETTRSRF